MDLKTTQMKVSKGILLLGAILFLGIVFFSGYNYAQDEILVTNEEMELLKTQHAKDDSTMIAMSEALKDMEEAYDTLLQGSRIARETTDSTISNIQDFIDIVVTPRDKEEALGKLKQK